MNNIVLRQYRQQILSTFLAAICARRPDVAKWASTRAHLAMCVSAHALCRGARIPEERAQRLTSLDWVLGDVIPGFSFHARARVDGEGKLGIDGLIQILAAIYFSKYVTSSNSLKCLSEV